MRNVFHWDPGYESSHPGLPGSCDHVDCVEENLKNRVDPLRQNLIVFIQQLVEDDLHDMGIDWDEDMERQYGPYDTVQDRVAEILEELE